MKGRESKRSEHSRLIPLPVTRPSAWNGLDLSAAEAARRRLATYVKRTPVVEAWLPAANGRSVRIHLKLENLQVAGGVHARGVLNTVLRLPKQQVARGLITTDGTGHHGVTVAYAGWLLGVRAMIYVPRGAATPDHLQLLRNWNASIVVGGRTWDETYRTALLRARRDRLAYIHLFDDPSLIAGYSTLGLELLDSLPDLEVLVMTAVAGGAQLQGVAMAIKRLRPSVRIVGVEHASAPRLYESLRAGHVVQLPPGHMDPFVGPSRVSQANLDLMRQFVDDVVLVTNEEVDYALRTLWAELDVGASIVGASALAAALAGKVRFAAHARVCAVIGVSGAEGLF